MYSPVTESPNISIERQRKDPFRESQSYDERSWKDIRAKMKGSENEKYTQIKKFPSVKTLPIRDNGEISQRGRSRRMRTLSLKSPRSKTPPGTSPQDENESPRSKTPPGTSPRGEGPPINTKLKSPRMKIPLPRSPGIKTPPVQSPRVKTPKMKTPPWQLSNVKSSRNKILEKLPPPKFPRIKKYIINHIYDLNYPLVIKSLREGQIQRYPSDKNEKRDFFNTFDGEKIIRILGYFPNDDSCLPFLAAYMGSIPILNCLRYFKVPYDLLVPTYNIRTSTYYAAKGGHLDALKWLLGVKAKINIITIDAADTNGHPKIVEWLLLEGNMLRKDSLLYSQYYLEYSVREDNLRILEQIHTYSGQWKSAQLYTEITEKTSRSMIEYLWDHEAPMLSIYFTPPNELKKCNLDQIIDWWCSHKNIDNGELFESYFRWEGKNRDLLNGKYKNEDELKGELLKRIFFSDWKDFVCPICKIKSVL